MLCGGGQNQGRGHPAGIYREAERTGYIDIDFLTRGFPQCDQFTARIDQPAANSFLAFLDPR